MAAHYDLLIRDGTCVLPWGMEATDVGVRNGRIAALGVGAERRPTDDRCTGLHVLPGLIDPHVHLRDPGDKTVEFIPTGTRARCSAGSPRCSTCRTPRPRWSMPRGWRGTGLRRARSPGATWGCMSAAPRRTFPSWRPGTGRGVCAIKIFAGSSTGDLMVEDDEHLEKVMRAGRRRIAYHSEDEYRLQARKPMFKSGDPFISHMEWRDEETRVPRHPAADRAGAQDRAAGAHPARLDRGGVRLPEDTATSRRARCW